MRKYKYKWRIWTPIAWWLLKKSGCFNYWLQNFLREFFYDLDILELERDAIRKKYLKKYYKTYQKRIYDPK